MLNEESDFSDTRTDAMRRDVCSALLDKGTSGRLDELGRLRSKSVLNGEQYIEDESTDSQQVSVFEEQEPITVVLPQILPPLRQINNKNSKYNMSKRISCGRIRSRQANSVCVATHTPQKTERLVASGSRMIGKATFRKSPPTRLVIGARDLVITENALEEALGTHGGEWPFDINSNKSPMKSRPDEEQQ